MGERVHLSGVVKAEFKYCLRLLTCGSAHPEDAAAAIKFIDIELSRQLLLGRYHAEHLALLASEAGLINFGSRTQGMSKVGAAMAKLAERYPDLLREVAENLLLSTGEYEIWAAHFNDERGAVIAALISGRDSDRERLRSLVADAAWRVEARQSFIEWLHLSPSFAAVDATRHELGLQWHDLQSALQISPRMSERIWDELFALGFSFSKTFLEDAGEEALTAFLARHPRDERIVSLFINALGIHKFEPDWRQRHRARAHDYLSLCDDRHVRNFVSAALQKKDLAAIELLSDPLPTSEALRAAAVEAVSAILASPVRSRMSLGQMGQILRRLGIPPKEFPKDARVLMTTLSGG